VAGPVDLSAATTAPIATGGKSPYKMTDDPKYASYFTLQETPTAGSSTGVSLTLKSPPPDPSPISYQLNVTDSTGITINQPIQVKFS